MSPLYGDNSRQTFSLITVALIIVNVVVLLRELAGMDAFVHQYALVPAVLYSRLKGLDA